MKWTAYDPETASALAAHLPNVEHAPARNKDALDSALDSVAPPASATGADSAAAAVLAPALDDTHTVVITMRTKAAAQPGSADDVPQQQPTSYEAGGFLGLSDDPVYEKKPS